MRSVTKLNQICALRLNFHSLDSSRIQKYIECPALGKAVEKSCGPETSYLGVRNEDNLALG